MLDVDAIGKTDNGMPAVIEASLQIGLGALICLLGPSAAANQSCCGSSLALPALTRAAFGSTVPKTCLPTAPELRICRAVRGL